MTEHEHLRALLAAFTETTGLAVSMSPMRLQALRHIHRRGITPEDVRAVLGWLRRTVERGVKGFTPASLEFRNAMNPDTLEERLLTLRQARARAKAAQAKPDVAQTRRLPDGRTEAVLAEGVAPGVDGHAVKRALAEFRRQMGGAK